MQLPVYNMYSLYSLTRLDPRTLIYANSLALKLRWTLRQQYDRIHDTTELSDCIAQHVARMESRETATRELIRQTLSRRHPAKSSAFCCSCSSALCLIVCSVMPYLCLLARPI